MAEIAVGIDLGTTNSLGCIFANGRLQVVPDSHRPAQRPGMTPSVVALDRQGELVVGYAALSYADVQGKGIREIKRKMGEQDVVSLGDRHLSPEQISALILQRVLENVLAISRHEVTEAVISVPAYFPDAHRRATLEAARLAGIDVLRLVNEPVAAALAYGFDQPDTDETILVFDFGGGTLDITVLELVDRVIDVKISHGNLNLGGANFDDALRSLIFNKFMLEYPSAKMLERSHSLIKSRVEEAKIDLSTQTSTSFFFPNIAMHEGSPIDLDVEITREEFQEAIVPLIEDTRECIFTALRKARLTPAEIDRVLLVGGSTYMPCVQSLLRHIFGEAVSSATDSNLAVVRGAALYAAIIKGLVEEDIILSDVVPYGLGFDMIRDMGRFEQLVYEPLILLNQKKPFSVRKTYSLRHEHQQTLEVNLYQDPSGNATLEDAIFTGTTAIINDIPRSESGSPHQVEIEFQHNVDGMVKLRVLIPATGQLVDVVYATVEKADRRASFSVARQTIQWKTEVSIQKHLAIIDKAEQKLKKLHGRDKRLLERSIERVRLAVETAGNVEVAVNELIDLLFALELGESFESDR